MKLTTKALTRISFNVALIATSAYITIPVGPVPFSLQIFAIYSIAFLNSRKTAVLSILLYILLGLVGFPIFSNGQGGLAILTSPTIGFILGFIPLTYITSSKKHDKFPLHVFIIASISLYLLGVLGLVSYFKYIAHIPYSIPAIVKSSVIVFIPSDFVAFTLSFEVSKKLITQLNLNLNEL
ncbi:MAG: biotin transporter BioY [Erysipelothrix sp.]|nr:biotin transporter BioY [Erysipelothrix sp.]